MITASIDINRPPKIISLGRQGEGNYRQIMFDISSWLSEYPRGTVSVVFKRHDGVLYPVVINQNTSPVVWVISSTDTLDAGYGAIELCLIIDDTIGKSAVVKTYTEASLGETGPMPTPPAPDWVLSVAENAAAAEDAVSHYPYIGPDRHWYVWNNGAWADTGVIADGASASALTMEQQLQLETAYEHSQDALTNSEIEALIRNFTE